jgi:hypothetical protein
MGTIQLIKRDTGDSVYVVRIITTSTLADVATTNYLHDQKAAIYAVNNGPFFWQLSDFVLVYAVDGWEQFTISPDFNSLIPFVSTGNVTLPVQDNHLPLFDGTTGRIKNSSMHYDSGALQIPGGDVIAGDAGVQGFFQSHPPTTGKGVMNFQASDQVGDFESTLTNDNFAQATNIIITDPGSATARVPVSTGNGTIVLGNTAYTMSSRVTLNIHCTVTQLNAGNVTVILSSGLQQFQFLNIYYSPGAAVFDNGGDRLVQLKTTTQVFATLPVVTLKGNQVGSWITTVVNSPSSPTAVSSLTNAGDPVVLAYSNGTTDYVSGDFFLTVDAIQVA